MTRIVTTLADAPAEISRNREARELLCRMAGLPVDDPERGRLRATVIEAHLSLVGYLARRFAYRGEPVDDLIQVGTVGLIKAVDRFEVDRGLEFSTYATPTIVGEIKRHFRDKGWSIRVPRRLQELRQTLVLARAELTQMLGRSPTVRELAGHLGIDEDDVVEGIEVGHAYSPLSLDLPSGPDDDGHSLTDRLAIDDGELAKVDYRQSLRPLIAGLPPRDKRILLMRFFRDMTQSEIARELDISQMHVSRLLARALAELRAGLTATSEAGLGQPT